MSRGGGIYQILENMMIDISYIHTSLDRESADLFSTGWSEKIRLSRDFYFLFFVDIFAR